MMMATMCKPGHPGVNPEGTLLPIVLSIVASLLLVAMPFVPSSFLLLVARPGAPSSVLAPSSDALFPSSFLLLVVRPGALSSVLAPSSDALSS